MTRTMDAVDRKKEHSNGWILGRNIIRLNLAMKADQWLGVGRVTESE